MQYSKIDICNIAFAHLGAAPIRDFDEKNKRARMADIFYEISANYILAKFDWSFARAFIKLNQLVIDPDTKPIGIFVYQLPSNCKTPRSLEPIGSRDKWEVVGDSLFTDKENVSLYYTRDDVIPAKYSDPFISLVALRLAVVMSPAITQDSKLTAILKTQYDSEQFESWEADANIGNTYREYDDDANNDTFVTSNLALTLDMPSIIT